MAEKDKGLALVLELTRIQNAFSKKIEARLAAHGLGYNDFVILHHLQQYEGKLRRIDLAEKVNVTASGITRLLAPMEKTGLVARETNERDARSSFVALTATGKRIYKEALKTVSYATAELFPEGKLRKVEMIVELVKEISS